MRIRLFLRSRPTKEPGVEGAPPPLQVLERIIVFARPIVPEPERDSWEKAVRGDLRHEFSYPMHPAPCKPIHWEILIAGMVRGVLLRWDQLREPLITAALASTILLTGWTGLRMYRSTGNLWDDLTFGGVRFIVSHALYAVAFVAVMYGLRLRIELQDKDKSWTQEVLTGARGKWLRQGVLSVLLASRVGMSGFVAMMLGSVCGLVLQSGWLIAKYGTGIFERLSEAGKLSGGPLAAVPWITGGLAFLISLSSRWKLPSHELAGEEKPQPSPILKGSLMD